MSTLFASGRIIDLILALVALEAVGLVLYRRQTGRGLQVPAIVLGLLPGVLLLVAVRAALRGARWEWIALLLALACVAHLVDFRRRMTHA